VLHTETVLFSAYRPRYIPYRVPLRRANHAPGIYSPPAVQTTPKLSPQIRKNVPYRYRFLEVATWAKRASGWQSGVRSIFAW